MRVIGILVSKIPDFCSECEMRKQCKALKRILDKGGKCPLVTLPIEGAREKVVGMDLDTAAEAIRFYLRDVIE